ncbi:MULTISPECIES: hypothetical protein [unclassified Stenotrophomonas]|uniref:hypothetical protein n=1 Tax=unclassified Stenotrophomonas TaxID=196198 RepID=UPI001F534DD3|nr:hypothetical protein [Stenotrophomonas maltophilia]
MFDRNPDGLVGAQNLQGVLTLDFAMKSIGQGFLCFLASTVSAVLIKDRPVLMLLLSQVLSIVIVFFLNGGRDLLQSICGSLKDSDSYLIGNFRGLCKEAGTGVVVFVFGPCDLYGIFAAIGDSWRDLCVIALAGRMRLLDRWHSFGAFASQMAGLLGCRDSVLLHRVGGNMAEDEISGVDSMSARNAFTPAPGQFRFAAIRGGP